MKSLRHWSRCLRARFSCPEARRMSSSGQNITSVLQETRVFPPPPSFAQSAHIKSAEEADAMRKWAATDPDGFWAEQAKSLTWFKPFTQVLDWSDAPHARWFVGGHLNASFNCLDRHLTTWRKNKAALIWEGEPGDSRTLTYLQLYREVCKFANAL